MANRTHRSQSWWGDLFHKNRRDLLLSHATGADSVRLTSQTLPHAMAWTAVLPAPALRTLIPSPDFQGLLQFHLGIPVLPCPDSACPRSATPLDQPGNHLICCHRNGITQRHGAVQDLVYRIVQRSGLTARKEQSAPDRTRPGDIFISRLDVNGPAAVDITVRHTLAPSRPLTSGTAVAAWFETQEQEKIMKYQGQCHRLGWTMVPFVMDCFGGMGRAAQALMGTCLRLLLGQKEAWARRSTEGDVWQGLSITLAKEVGRQLRLGRFAGPGEDSLDDGEGISWSHQPYLSRL